MQQFANGFFAVHVVSFQAVYGAHHFGCSFDDFRKKQVGLFRMMQSFWKFSDVEKHRAHDFKKFLFILHRSSIYQLHHGMKHGSKRGVLIANNV